MSANEAEKKLQALKKKSVVLNISTFNSILTTEFKIDYNEYTNFGKAFCFFENNKLSELQIDTTNQLNSNLVNLFVQKYGDCDFFAEIDGNYEYHWINGNRHISIAQLGESKNLIIIYKDTTQKISENNLILLKRFKIESEQLENNI